MTILSPSNPDTISRVAINTLPFAFGAAICIREQRSQAGENFDDIDADREYEVIERGSRRSDGQAVLDVDQENLG